MGHTPTTTTTSANPPVQTNAPTSPNNNNNKLDEHTKENSEKELNIDPDFEGLSQEELDQKLIKICNQRTNTPQDKKALAKAAAKLISLGANVNSLEYILPTQRRPIIFSVYQNKNIELFRLLLDNGANVNACDNTGLFTLLQYICDWHVLEEPRLLEKGHEFALERIKLSLKANLEMVKLLLEKGADVSIQNCYAPPVLHSASLRGRKEMVIELLSYGANPLLLDSSKCRASAMAKTPEIKEILLEAEKHWEIFGCSKAKIDNAKKIVRLVEKYELCTNIKDEGPRRKTLRKFVETEALKLNDTFKLHKLSKEEISNLIEFYGDRSHLQVIKGGKSQDGILKDVLSGKALNPGTEITGPNDNTMPFSKNEQR